MDYYVNLISQHIFSGKADSVIAVLFGGLALLIYDRIRIIKKLTDTEQKYAQVLDDYYKATILLSQAFDSLKIVLNELKSKMQ